MCTGHDRSLCVCLGPVSTGIGFRVPRLHARSEGATFRSPTGGGVVCVPSPPRTPSTVSPTLRPPPVRGPFLEQRLTGRMEESLVLGRNLLGQVVEDCHRHPSDRPDPLFPWVHRSPLGPCTRPRIGFWPVPVWMVGPPKSPSRTRPYPVRMVVLPFRILVHPASPPDWKSSSSRTPSST